MKANKKIRDKANAIAREYSRRCHPLEVAEMYDRLEAEGIRVGLITNRRDSEGSWHGTCEWFFNGEEVENSLFVFSVYEGGSYSGRSEYNIYFS